MLLKFCLTIIFLIASLSAYCDSDIINEINLSEQLNNESEFKKFRNKISLGYFINISGPTLASPGEGHTYSRYQSGKTWDGRHKLDPRMNQNYFNSFKINYKYSNNVTLNYSYAFDNVITKNIKYKTRTTTCDWDSNKQACKKDADGFYILKNSYFDGQQTRNEQQSFYNQRIGAFFSELFTNDYTFISSGINLELPTTKIAKNDNMQLAIIMTPSISYKFSNFYHSAGISTEFIKTFYQDNIIQGKDTSNARAMRTFQMTLSPFYNYSLSNKLILSSCLIFDWDQKGNDDILTFNNNMDDVARIGLDYLVNHNISTKLYIEGAIEDPSFEKSFIGLNFSLNI